MEIDFTAIDNDLNRLPRSKANSLDVPLEKEKEPTPEGNLKITIEFYASNVNFPQKM